MLLLPRLAALALAALLARAAPLSARQLAPPLDHYVQGVYFVEADMPYSAAQEAAVRTQVRAVQRMWLDNFGATFPLAEPPVHVVRADHEQAWYLRIETGDNDRYYRLENMAAEIKHKMGYTRATAVRVIVYPTSTHDGQTGGVPGPDDGFGGAFMDGDDIRCVTDNGSTNTYAKSPASCIGHVAHEFGHAFGLIHEGPPTDCMVAEGLYDLNEDCTFGAENRQTVVSTQSKWLTVTSLDAEPTNEASDFASLDTDDAPAPTICAVAPSAIVALLAVAYTYQ